MFSIPPITRILISINVVMFLIQGVIGNGMSASLALWPVGIAPAIGLAFEPWQLITYAFLHGSWTHLLFNMFALFMFGGQVEVLLGAKRFMELYFAAVITAALTQLVVSYMMGSPYPTVGASGGIFGLLLAYGIYFPQRMIALLIPPVMLPAKIFVVLYGALELVLGVTGTQAGVAHFAHLGGMFGAWVLIRYWRGGPRRRR